MGDWQVPGYRQLRELGQGAAGRVVLALHTATETPVAIKYLTERLLADEDFLLRFRAEARLLAGIDNPNLVRFHEYVESIRKDAPAGSPPRGAGIVMELVDGVSLDRLIKAEGATGPEAALVVLKGSLLGLAAAHSIGVVHRDYKPGNILVSGDGTSKLADFGIAVRAGENVPAAGTPAYMPPEQWSGRPVTPATDVYAATAVCYECLTGERPFPGKTLPQLALAHRTAPVPVEQVPEPLRALISHGMAKAAHDRPQSAMAFVEELETTALAAYGPGWEERGRNRLAELAALLALLFPLAQRPALDASALAETQLGGRDIGRKTVRRLIMPAAAGVAMLLLGGTGVLVYATSSGGGGNRPAAAGPGRSISGAASTGPSANPSGEPSADPATPAATPVTPPPAGPPPAGTGTGGTGGAAPIGPPVPPVTLPPVVSFPAGSPISPVLPPPTPEPPPFEVTDVSVSPGSRSGQSASWRITVTTNRPTGKVTLSITFAAGRETLGSTTLQESEIPYVFSANWDKFPTPCQDWTITVVAGPGGVSGGNTIPAEDCGGLE